MTSTKKKLLGILQEKNSRLKDFLDQAKKVNDIVPTVKDALESTELVEKVITGAPKEATSVFDDPFLEHTLLIDLNIWKQKLPQLSINPAIFSGGTSGATGTATQVIFSAISTVTGPQPVMNWVHQYQTDYSVLQQKQQKPLLIQTRLKSINMIDEFTEANKLYLQAEALTIPPKSAAASMRNTIEHFVGNLVDKARKNPRENVKKKIDTQWKFISDRLVIGGIGSFEHSLLIDKYKEHQIIHLTLTNILKNLDPHPLENLKITHVKWIDYLYTCIQLIDPKYL